MSGFVLRDVNDWNGMVKAASLKLAQPVPAPAAPPMPPAPDSSGPVEEGMPIAPGRKPMPNEDKPAIAPEPTEYLQKEHKEIENAKSIVMQMWGLLTGEAGEGGYDEVKYLLDAIKSMEDFITVEETGVKPGKGGKAKTATTDEDAVGGTEGPTKEEEIDQMKQQLVDRVSDQLSDGMYNAWRAQPANRRKRAAAFLRYAGRVKEVLLPLYEALSAAREKALGQALTDDEECEMWEEAAKVYRKKLKPSEPEIEELAGPASFLPDDLKPGGEQAGEFKPDAAQDSTIIPF